MSRKLDRIMYDISVFYIALPVFIFLATWLRAAVAVPMCIIFAVSFFFLFRNKPAEIDWTFSRKNIRPVVIVLILLAAWVFLSGIGGFSFQNTDYSDRNAIFHDLIEKAWPVTYHFSGQLNQANQGSIPLPAFGMLTYYISFWLPAALFGKVFGWYAANAFLLFWTFTGVVLVTYYVFRTLRRVCIRSALILILFSGLDILGYIRINNGAIPSPIAHIEWWAGNYQYSSNTTMLFWVFNQTIVIWLAVLLVLHMKNVKSVFFLLALLLPYGPFPFVGMIPFVLWKVYQGYPFPEKADKKARLPYRALLWIWKGVLRAVSFENIAGGLSIILLFYLYFAGNITAGSYVGLNHFGTSYFWFIIFEVGIYLTFLFPVNYNKPVYWICTVCLVIIPFFEVGSGQDFCMRVSIPALFLLQLMLQKALLGKHTAIGDTAEGFEGKSSEEPFRSIDEVFCAKKRFYTFTARDRKILTAILIAVFCIGAVVPMQEMTRSVWYTFPEYPSSKFAIVSTGKVLEKSSIPEVAKWGRTLIDQSGKGQLWFDFKQSLLNVDIYTANYIGTTKGDFFYSFLARHP